MFYLIQSSSNNFLKNKKGDVIMYGVIYIICFPHKEDPKMQSLELFNSYDEAEKRTQEIIKEFIEEYGEDLTVYATPQKPVAIMFNGEVTAYAYIKKVSNNA